MIYDLQSTLMDRVFLIAPRTDILRRKTRAFFKPDGRDKKLNLLLKDLSKCSSK